MTSRKFRTKPH